METLLSTRILQEIRQSITLNFHGDIYEVDRTIWHAKSRCIVAGYPETWRHVRRVNVASWRRITIHSRRWKNYYYEQNTTGKKQCLMRKQKNWMDVQQWLVSLPQLDLILQQVKSSQVCGERHVTHCNFHDRRVHLCCPIDWWKCWWWWQRTRWWTDATCVCTQSIRLTRKTEYTIIRGYYETPF